MAKRQSNPFKASAKLRKALSGFAAGHEQLGKTFGDMAAAVAASAYTFTPAQVERLRAALAGIDGNAVLAAHRKERERFERELADRADLLLREIAPPPRQPRQQKTRRPRDLVKAVVRDFWPNGVPETETDKELLRQLGNELDRRGICAEVTTLRRALGLRRD